MTSGKTPPAAVEYDGLDIGRLYSRRRYGRYVSGILTIGALAVVFEAFRTSLIDWSVVRQYLFDMRIIEGLGRTVLLSILSMVFGLMIGAMVALMRMSSNPVAASVSWAYVWLFRGTPALLQVLMFFNIALIVPVIAIPGLFEVRTIDVMTPFVAAVLAFSLNEGAYLAEIIRGGILSVNRGQTEAATSLGMSPFARMRYVVFPQAMPAVIPAIGNQTIGVLKLSSFASVISYTELLHKAQDIYYVNGRVMELLMVASVWYLVATTVANIGQYYLERHFRRSELRGRNRVAAAAEGVQA